MPDRADPAAAIAARHGESDPPAPPPMWNDTLGAIFAHRSVRAFLDRPLPDGMAELLAQAGQSASTSSNFQVWSVVAVADPARRDRLARLAADQAFIREAPLLLVWLADLARLEALSVLHQRPAAALDYLETFMVGLVDVALAAQNAAIAAESLGLGCCYVGAVRNHPEAVAAELALPRRTMAVFGMAVGWPDPARATGIKPRLPLAAVLHREQYRPPAPALFGEYEARLAAYQQSQALHPVGWAETMLGRIADAPALRGRERMKAAVAALGFPLA